MKTEQDIALAEGKRDFRRVPDEVFFEGPSRDVYVSRLEKFLNQACQEILDRDPKEFFGEMRNLLQRVGLSIHLGRHDSVRKIIDEFRLKAAKKLTDEEFQDLFGGKKATKRFSHTGIRQGEQTEEAKELRDYLVDRRKSLSGEK